MSANKTYATLTDLLSQDLAGRIILLRTDYNLPLDASGQVADQTRLIESLDSLRALQEKDAKVLILAHLGNPQGTDPQFSLRPIVRPLETLLGKEIIFLDKPLPEIQRNDLEALPSGGFALAENLRFSAGEKTCDKDFAKHLAGLGDFYVLDGFSVAHRAHASIVGIAPYLPACAGLALDREVKTLNAILGRANQDSIRHKKSLAIVGGAKISTKLPLLYALLERFDQVAVGGGLANTLLAAQGYALGNSIIENQALTAAQELARSAKDRLLLPSDLVVAEKTATGWGAPALVSIQTGVAQGAWALDLGEATLARLTSAIHTARLVVWNGPLGLFETAPFDAATLGLVRALETSPAQVVAGGGETLLAIERAGADRQNFAHLSTGGGAFLTWLEGRPLAGLTALEKSLSAKSEYGGPQGAEPTRYGDWERGGRAIDF